MALFLRLGSRHDTAALAQATVLTEQPQIHVPTHQCHCKRGTMIFVPSPIGWVASPIIKLRLIGLFTVTPPTHPLLCDADNGLRPGIELQKILLDAVTEYHAVSAIWDSRISGFSLLTRPNTSDAPVVRVGNGSPHGEIQVIRFPFKTRDCPLITTGLLRFVFAAIAHGTRDSTCTGQQTFQPAVAPIPVETITPLEECVSPALP